MRTLPTLMLCLGGCVGYELPPSEAPRDAAPRLDAGRFDSVSNIALDGLDASSRADGGAAAPRRVPRTLGLRLTDWPCDAPLALTLGAPTQTLRAMLLRGQTPEPGTRNVISFERRCEGATLRLDLREPLAPRTALTLTDGARDLALEVLAPALSEPRFAWVDDRRASQLFLRADRALRPGSLAPSRVTLRCSGRPLDLSVTATPWGLSLAAPSLTQCPPEAQVTVSLEAAAVTAENGQPNLDQRLALGAPASETPRFDVAPRCVGDERKISPFCVLSVGAGVVLRGAVVGAAVLEITAPARLSWARWVLASGPFSVQLDRQGWPDAERLGSLRVRLLREAPAGAETIEIGSLLLAPREPALQLREALFRARGGAAGDYLELLNLGPGPRSLDGVTLLVGATRYPLARGYRLEAGQRAVVTSTRYNPRGEPALGVSGLASGAVWVPVSGLALRDGGAAVALVDAAGVVLAALPGDRLLGAPREGVGVTWQGAGLDVTDPAGWGDDLEGRSTPGYAGAGEVSAAEPSAGAQGQ